MSMVYVLFTLVNVAYVSLICQEEDNLALMSCLALRCHFQQPV